MKFNKKRIEKMMSNCYVPTLADTVRLYKEYKPATNELTVCLRDAYSWLLQEPTFINYKNGELYLRCEMTTEDVLAVHYIYINKQSLDTVILDDFYAPDVETMDITAFTLKELFGQIKEIVSYELEQRNDCE